MRWCCIRAVNDLESIGSCTCSVLWKQHNIAELNTCNSQFSVGSRHIFAWELAVCLHHFLVFLWSKRLFHPTFVLVFGYKSRLSVLHKVVERTLGI